MSLEGRLRELGLPEVLQLLGLSRKTGRLQLRAPLQGRAGFVQLAHGAITDAAQWRLTEVDIDARANLAGVATATDGRKAVSACVLDLLRWRDGDFRFDPQADAPAGGSVRLAAELLLMESAQQAERWEQIAERVPDAHAIPGFIDVEPQQLPLLRLEPQEWEILTRVDGTRDLRELAVLLDRDVVDVAEIVLGLIGSGLLALREAERAPRRNPTPPIGTAALLPAHATPALARQTIDAPRDLWIPHGDDHLSAEHDPHDDDSIFDPIEVGVTTFDGYPRAGTRIHDENTVATMRADPSLQRGEASSSTTDWNASTLCSHGDDAARRGDLAGALGYWSAALRSDATMIDADRIREAIALAARLHALLHPAAPRV
jgi:hypothetical protein